MNLNDKPKAVAPILDPHWNSDIVCACVFLFAIFGSMVFIFKGFVEIHRPLKLVIPYFMLQLHSRVLSIPDTSNFNRGKFVNKQRPHRPNYHPSPPPPPPSSFRLTNMTKKNKRI